MTIASTTPYPVILPALKGLAYIAERKIPFHAELSLRIVHLTEGHAVAHIPWRPGLIGDTLRPAIHGGIISLLVDVVGGFAALSSTADTSARVSTIDLRTDYLRPGKANVDLFGVGRVIRCGTRIAVARMEIYSSDQVPPAHPTIEIEPIALGQASYNVHRDT